MGVDVRFDKWENATGETVCHNGTVWLGTNTMKGFGKNVAIALNELHKKHCNNFSEFLIEANQNANIDKSQLEILIKLNWFENFGNNGKLLQMYNLFNNIYGRKVFSKDKCYIPHEIMVQYSKETEKQYREVNSNGLLSFMCDSIHNYSLPLETMLQTQSEVCGYVSYCDPSKVNVGVVMDVNCQYTPKFQIHRIDNGETVTVKLKKRMYEQNPIPVGSIIDFRTESKYGWKKVNDKWEEDTTKIDNWITNYRIIQYV